MSNKLHKPGANSQATLNRQGKHTKTKDKPTSSPPVDKETIPEAPVVTTDKTKKELKQAAEELGLSTKGNKITLVERINNAD